MSEVFKGFWRKFNDRKWRDTVSKVVQWYLRSNESNEFEVGIVLSQAALERLAHAVIGDRQGRKEGEWFAQAIEKSGINCQIPNSCSELVQLQEERGWSSGPHALVDLRNDLIHPVNRHGIVSANVYSEAWNLGQWYIELMLLSLFNHNGLYCNRLRYNDKSGRGFDPVPWAK